MKTYEIDPVCGMTVDPRNALKATHKDQEFFFCSDLCLREFRRAPASHVGRRLRKQCELKTHERHIAYFSMEIALEEAIPTYSGGLGVLAGDTLLSCADLRVPLVAVSLIYRNGYLRQHLDESGWQTESALPWSPEDCLEALPETTHVTIEGRPVHIRAWQYGIKGSDGFTVPVILLDTSLPENSEYDRTLTAQLYGGDEAYRLAQEIVLGIGGTRMLRKLGYARLRRFHMNEGHAALLTAELLRRGNRKSTLDYEGVRNRCVFTTHTPVPAGHDRFSYDLVDRLLGHRVNPEALHMLGGDDALNMTHLALNLSRYVNGVAQRHEEVSREMFPGYPIHHVTNGVHSTRWTSEPFRALYDRHIPGWQTDFTMLRHALCIPKDELWTAHQEAKDSLLQLVRDRTGQEFSRDVFTIGFARRATAYKRPDLLFQDLGWLKHIASSAGPLQLVFAGKAHPRDKAGKEIIQRLVGLSRELRDPLRLVFIEDYDMGVAKALVAGVDLWLNTPQRPLEASGTSGMKAAHNGVPSFSVLDGWWIEGHVEGVTGWSIGPASPPAVDAGPTNDADARDMYTKLEYFIVPRFYRQREEWVTVMRNAVALNASYFNTYRMVQEYVTKAYLD